MMRATEKLHLMEGLWEDMRERFDCAELAQDTRDLLDRRRSRVRDGVATLLDWKTAKSTLGQC